MTPAAGFSFSSVLFNYGGLAGFMEAALLDYRFFPVKVTLQGSAGSSTATSIEAPAGETCAVAANRILVQRGGITRAIQPSTSSFSTITS
jgi:hypothetical protein